MERRGRPRSREARRPAEQSGEGAGPPTELDGVVPAEVVRKVARRDAPERHQPANEANERRACAIDIGVGARHHAAAGSGRPVVEGEDVRGQRVRADTAKRRHDLQLALAALLQERLDVPNRRPPQDDHPTQHAALAIRRPHDEDRRRLRPAKAAAVASCGAVKVAASLLGMAHPDLRHPRGAAQQRLPLASERIQKTVAPTECRPGRDPDSGRRGADGEPVADASAEPGPELEPLRVGGGCSCQIAEGPQAATAAVAPAAAEPAPPNDVAARAPWACEPFGEARGPERLEDG